MGEHSTEKDVTPATAEARLRHHLAATTGGMGDADLNIVLGEASQAGMRTGLQFTIGVILGVLQPGPDRERILSTLRVRRDGVIPPASSAQPDEDGGAE